MSLSIEILNLGDVLLDSAFEVRGRNSGLPNRCRTVGYLIHGLPDGLMLVDTGYRSPEIMETIGMRAAIPDGAGLEAELDRRDLRFGDIRHVLHTHLHIDHAGKDDLFPMSTTVIMNRDELGFACGGIVGSGYPADDVKHLLDRVYTKDAAWLLDLTDALTPYELFPGLAVQLAGGHTRGSLNVLVETAEGTACICGDVFYDIMNQYVTPFHEINHREMRIATNTSEAERAEKAAMKKVLQSGNWVLPMHEAPSRLGPARGVVGRVEGIMIPGPVTSGSGALH